MKRSVLFWPLVVAGCAVMFWLLACSFVLGWPSDWGCRSPALLLFGPARTVAMATDITRAVNALGRIAPYASLGEEFFFGADCGRSDDTRPWVMIVFARPTSDPASTTVRGLSLGEVWWFIFVLPALHVGAAIALVGLALVSVTRALSRVMLTSGEDGQWNNDADNLP